MRLGTWQSSINKPKTLRQKVELLASKKDTVATSDYFCILCEEDIQRRQKYKYVSRILNAHSTCVVDAMASIKTLEMETVWT